MTALLHLIWQSRVLRAVGGALVALLALVGFGAAQRRKGAVAARNERAAADAKETIEALETRDEVEADVARGGDAHERLRKSWRE